MKRQVTPPPVTVCISGCYDDSSKHVLKTIVEVFNIGEEKIKCFEGTQVIRYLRLEYDEFQQIYASLHVELENSLREVQQIPNYIENNCANFNLSRWYAAVDTVISLLQDFREAERGYLSARLTLARNLMLDESGKEAGNE